MIFEQRPKRNEEAGLAHTREGDLGRGNSQCKSSRQGMLGISGIAKRDGVCGREEMCSQITQGFSLPFRR